MKTGITVTMSQFSNLEMLWDWLWSFIHRQKKSETSYRGRSVFVQRLTGSCNTEIRLHQKTTMVYFSPSSSLFWEDEGQHGPRQAYYYYTILSHVGPLAVNTTTVLLTVLRFSLWHSRSQAWTPWVSANKTNNANRVS